MLLSLILQLKACKNPLTLHHLNNLKRKKASEKGVVAVEGVEKVRTK